MSRARRLSYLEVSTRYVPPCFSTFRAPPCTDRASAHPLRPLQVCELVDNELLGEGTLFSIADARRRLLTPGARVVPRGALAGAAPSERF